jgi:long-chain fatty acid transport protein
VKKLVVAALVCSIIGGAGSVLATNGDNLIGIGPVSRGMGGVGIARPQDSISAIFNNPAALGACPCGPESETVFGVTVFDPTVTARIKLLDPATGAVAADFEGQSGGQAFIIPAVGVTTDLGDGLRMGVGAYGVSGLGADYRNKGWDLDPSTPGAEGDVYTRLEIMKFAGLLSYQLLDNLSVGAALQGTYNNLDLEQGGSHDYGIGGQIGALLDLGVVAIGASYTSPQKSDHKGVYDLDFDGVQDDLTLEAPASYGVGVAVTPSETLLVEVDAKYLDWANAEGYEDFDWDSQWVFAIGAQLRATEKLAVRCGYNYGESPVVEHNGWNPMPTATTTVQGKEVPTFGYEMLRTVGFPAIVESHVTLGLSYQVAEAMAVHLGYMHGFENTISETSAFGAVQLESDLEEDTYSFSLSWAY